MKRITKIFVNILAVLMIALSCSLFVACEDIKVLEVKVNVYNTTEQKMEEKTLEIDLYRHLAPNTVDTIISYVNEGYYNDTFFYVNADFASQLMIGELKFDNTNKTLVQNLDANGALKNSINGEFANNNVVGSNLKNVEGSIGLWRDWTAGGNYNISDDTRNSGRATWYMPTADLSSTYDGWFCVFGQFNMDTSSESYKTYNSIKTLLNDSAYYENYVIYYTKDGDSLKYNCVTETDFASVDSESVFKAEGAELKRYNKTTVRVPLVDKNNKSNKSLAISIASIAVK